MKIVVLDGYCLNPGDLSWDALNTLGEVRVYDRTPPASAIDRIGDAEAVLLNKIPLSAETLAACPSLRYVGVLATGYNVVDVAAAASRGIAVTNIPTYGTASVAQHAIAMLLNATNQVARHARVSRRGEWSRNPDWSFAVTPLIELAGKTIGIVGFGRIGQQTARIAAALGMKVLAYDHKMDAAPADFPFTWISLRGLLEESDVVSLHVPLFPDTKGLINAQTLKRMKPSAILINTSRGPLIDEEALAEALQSRTIAAAALDVLCQEPPAEDNPLLRLDNCVITPHVAWATREARERLLGMAVDNLRAWLAGSPQNVVA